MRTAAATTVTLAERYQRELQARGWQSDPAQLAVIARLERLRNEVLAAHNRPDWSRTMRLWRHRACNWLGRSRRGPGASGASGLPRGSTGVYLWGGVGRGKTWLMDLFYCSLGPNFGRRIHFHHLMQDVHAGLACLGQGQNPVKTIAANMASRASLWCLDELHVYDIADAMLLRPLFEELIDLGVTLVITSNLPPRDLYRDGLQRARFLPAISVLERHLDVLQVDAGSDYRLRQLSRASIYLSTADPLARGQLNALFAAISAVPTSAAGFTSAMGSASTVGSTSADGLATAAGPLMINGRPVATQRLAGDAVWFDFSTLCQGQRSASDYIALASEFQTVVLSDIPLLDEAQHDATRRFISLVDEFYDRGVKLVVSAAAQPNELYRGERLAFEYRRTASRLIQMQSQEYLARAHTPARD